MGRDASEDRKAMLRAIGEAYEEAATGGYDDDGGSAPLGLLTGALKIEAELAARGYKVVPVEDA